MPGERKAGEKGRGMGYPLFPGLSQGGGEPGRAVKGRKSLASLELHKAKILSIEETKLHDQMQRKNLTWIMVGFFFLSFKDILGEVGRFEDGLGC